MSEATRSDRSAPTDQVPFPPFVALTPAHNEADHLPGLIESIVAQEIQPTVWVIVNDGSSDATGQVAERYAEDHPFIRVVNRERSQGRRLSAKAESVGVAYEVAREICPEAEFVVSMDADIELPSNMFARLLEEFAQNPKLGITGGIYLHPVNGELVANRVSATHVPGPLQFFRREVFDAVGGYQPLTDGGLDVVSTAHARMLGWETRATEGLNFQHNRRMGTGGGRHPLSAEYKHGIRDYSLGSSLVFELAKCARRMFDSPPVVGSAVRMAGYTKALLTRRPSAVPEDVAQFIRDEQLSRLLPWRDESAVAGPPS